MDHRSVLLLTVVLGSAALASSACTGPAAGSVSFSEGTSEAVKDSKTGSSSGAKSSSGDSPDGPAAAADPVFKDAFTAGTAQGGPAKGQASHTVLPAPANATKDPSGLNCMQAGCHIDTFAFGGTLYADVAGSAPVAGAEIRVTGPDGKTYASTFSDADGNFWASSTGVPIPAGSRVGVRKDGKVQEMGGKVEGADGAKCNNTTCHGSPTFRVNLN
jgi:hypothetical protein